MFVATSLPAIFKKDIRIQTGITTNALVKLGKNEYVSIGILEKICAALEYDILDVVEFTELEKVKDELPCSMKVTKAKGI